MNTKLFATLLLFVSQLALADKVESETVAIHSSNPIVMGVDVDHATSTLSSTDAPTAVVKRDKPIISTVAASDSASTTPLVVEWLEAYLWRLTHSFPTTTPQVITLLLLAFQLASADKVESETVAIHSSNPVAKGVDVDHATSTLSNVDAPSAIVKKDEVPSLTAWPSSLITVRPVPFNLARPATATRHE
ncbi:hypothetical protein GGI26_005760 [Coemansia sp. RSA 1358]|uniref:Uncharacterized protein n=1 Tax=Coemansia umbellata TaxID=1424467 RepID=A0ABQ8PF85_9FUNG|nr:hypothetical protein EDC05_005556 [Coemansia umbellata]KAJ2619522.1 hypothetical protein GGI26_005760 [Coemansia sp. RSA 1358]